MQEQIVDRLAESPCSIGELFTLCTGVKTIKINDMDISELMQLNQFMRFLQPLIDSKQVQTQMVNGINYLSLT